MLYPIWERRYDMKYDQTHIDEYFIPKDYLEKAKVLLSEIQVIMELDVIILIKLSEAVFIIFLK